MNSLWNVIDKARVWRRSATIHANVEPAADKDPPHGVIAGQRAF
jgi:hypothetical protein